MEKNIYRYLKGLKDSDFQIVEGEPNIIGWSVKSETGTPIGAIDDLLFDPESRSVRYLIVNLEHNEMNLDVKKVMVPIGTAHLHTADDEVVLPSISTAQLSSLPAYDADTTVPATEIQVAQVFGAAEVDHNETQRERAIAEFNQSEFYQHEHFNKDRFYQRSGINTQNQHTATGRSEQQQTIHDLIDNSERNDHHAAAPESGSNTHHNEGRKEDNRDGDLGQ
jgi:sporulation protein YlmC with PRC-barrel domain